jgi:hypothetical protein
MTYRPTQPVSLHGYKHKDRRQIIEWYVQKYETPVEVVGHEIPVMKMPAKPKFTVASLYAFSRTCVSIMMP